MEEEGGAINWFLIHINAELEIKITEVDYLLEQKWDITHLNMGKLM